MDDERWMRPRSATSARLLTDFAVDRKVAEQTVLDDTGILPETLDDPAAEITARQELQLVSNLVRALGPVPGLGFLAGMRYHITAHGIWGFAVASSPDLRAALDVGVRYAELSFSLSWVYLRRERSQLSIVIDDSALPPEVRPFLLERDCAALAMMQRDIIGTRTTTSRARLPLPCIPLYEVLAAEYLSNDAEFDAPETSLTFDAAVLSMRLPNANPHTAALYERQCAELLQRRKARAGVSGRVRRLLIHRGMAAQRQVAADLGMSIRTLRRRLAAEETTFRELSDETFGMLAEDLLRTGLTVEQVSKRLGYSSASAFSVAFRSWRGQTPGQFARRTLADIARTGLP